jgi:UDP-GlcNAc3NAcA epimerase
MMAMPEEQNRRVTDHLSTWLFCPTETAVNNLSREGIVDCGVGLKPDIDKKQVSLIGDIMYDASLYYRKKNTGQAVETGFVLLTIHRAENTDNPDRLKSIVRAINDLSDYQFIFPIHPRTKKVLIQEKLAFAGHVKIIEPVGYLEMLVFESACSMILTDSGGVQREAYFFNKPCITLMNSTPWVELVQSGWNTLAGTNREKIVYAVRNSKAPATHPDFYGSGHAAEKIISLLEK